MVTACEMKVTKLSASIYRLRNTGVSVGYLVQK